ncbi:MAG: porin family protein [Aequorivita sp.]
MKKLFFVAAITAMSVSMTQAQEVRLGAKGGVNFASIGGDNTDDNEGLTGFHIGALVEVPVTERFAVQPEVLYSAQGAKREFTQSFSDVSFKATGKTKLDYINVPIMAKYYIVDGLAVEAGPQVGFLVSANAESELDLSGVDPAIAELIEDEFESGDIDISDQTKGVDFGVALGASYRLYNGIFFGARYTLGLTDINDFSGTSAKNQNNVFQLSAGYSF